MFDHELAMNAQNQVSRLVNTIVERTEGVRSIDDFLCSHPGGMLLDAVCMNLIAFGEATKNLDKITAGQLLSCYPQIRWEDVMRMWDKIAHHDFEVDAEAVLLTVKEDIPQVKEVVEKMIVEMNNKKANRYDIRRISS
ncbi:MAG: DUF86 domain-containing protein [Bacteroidales bacterium]|nr:DUF86 domain-containing protein [Bacteroidales bacterium]